ncbi:MAG: FAD binding domain-containing protein [Firmicutes bacterium]|nr:FAD binding domain-containing protein [Bacillota bacterium]
MRLPEFAYLAPEDLQEAINLIGKYKNQYAILAGGTDLMIKMKQRLRNAPYVISLDQIAPLKTIREEASRIIIGPMNTLDEIINSPIIKAKLPALRQAAWKVGSPLLRAVATIGGNICLNTRCRFYNQSDFWRLSREKCFKAGGHICHVANKMAVCYSGFVADTVPALIAYNAIITLAGAGGTRKLPLADFYTGDGRRPNQIQRGSNEILTEIEIPVPGDDEKTVYCKYRVRESIDFPVVGAAVTVKKDARQQCLDARIILIGVGSAPLEAKLARDKMVGRSLDADLIAEVAATAAAEIHPVKTDLVAPSYKRKIARVVVAEALRAAGEA